MHYVNQSIVAAYNCFGFQKYLTVNLICINLQLSLNYFEWCDTVYFEFTLCILCFPCEVMLTLQKPPMAICNYGATQAHILKYLISKLYVAVHAWIMCICVSIYICINFIVIWIFNC